MVSQQEFSDFKTLIEDQIKKQFEDKATELETNYKTKLDEKVKEIEATYLAKHNEKVKELESSVDKSVNELMGKWCTETNKDVGEAIVSFKNSIIDELKTESTTMWQNNEQEMKKTVDILLKGAEARVAQAGGEKSSSELVFIELFRKSATMFTQKMIHHPVRFVKQFQTKEIEQNLSPVNRRMLFISCVEYKTQAWETKIQEGEELEKLIPQFLNLYWDQTAKQSAIEYFRTDNVEKIKTMADYIEYFSMWYDTLAATKLTAEQIIDKILEKIPHAIQNKMNLEELNTKEDLVKKLTVAKKSVTDEYLAMYVHSTKYVHTNFHRKTDPQVTEEAREIQQEKPRVSNYKGKNFIPNFHEVRVRNFNYRGRGNYGSYVPDSQWRKPPPKFNSTGQGARGDLSIQNMQNGTPQNQAPQAPNSQSIPQPTPEQLFYQNSKPGGSKNGN
ncbi:uncharacterized protein LOC135831546 [Planococcus citri]|uniref:uncharacterized protein LOC135831546 n=1 Tax=Planococcus citri TaxID=170843 RepID=UPI0031FA1BBF